MDNEINRVTINYDPELVSRKSSIWAIGLFLIILISLISLSFFALSDENLYYPLSIISAVQAIELFYPEPVDRQELLTLARQSIFAELDRYSGYIEKESYDFIQEEFTGSYGGIGITVVSHDDGLLIMSVRENGPAGGAGILTGDVIIRADTVALSGYSPFESAYLLRGEAGTTVEVEISRNHFDSTFIFNLTRENLKLIHIPYAGITPTNNFYIRILDFESGAYEELSGYLDSLYFENQDSIKGIIVDLRGNPGGLLSEVISVADLFLDKDQLIVGVKGKSYWSEREFHADDHDIFEGKPVTVLVDGGSASAAEILAGALKYHNRATLIGDTTFGKGLVQRYTKLDDGSGIRLTVSRYYFSGGQYINEPGADNVDSGQGISPDIFVSTVGGQPFASWLESSGYLREFALDNSSDIARFAPFTNRAEKWFIDFKKYLSDQEFTYQSDMTSLSQFMQELILYENRPQVLFDAADKIFRISKDEDTKLIDHYRQHVISRLYQLAVEAEQGAAESYRQAIIPFRQEIILAEEILLEKSDAAGK